MRGTGLSNIGKYVSAGWILVASHTWSHPAKGALLLGVPYARTVGGDTCHVRCYRLQTPRMYAYYLARLHAGTWHVLSRLAECTVGMWMQTSCFRNFGMAHIRPSDTSMRLKLSLIDNDL